jgi:hypothetical protein
MSDAEVLDALAAALCLNDNHEYDPECSLAGKSACDFVEFASGLLADRLAELEQNAKDAS